MQKYTLEKGDLENGFSLNKNLEGTMRLIPGRSMGTAVLYEVRVMGWNFEGCSFDDDSAKKKLKDSIVGKYQYFERVGMTERLIPEEESLRCELSDLLTKMDEKVN